MMKKISLVILFVVTLLLSSCATKLPVEKGTFKETHLVELIRLDSTIN